MGLVGNCNCGLAYGLGLTKLIWTQISTDSFNFEL